MATDASRRWNRLLELAERDGTFAPTFIEKLQQASSDNRILHELCQYALHVTRQQLTSIVQVCGWTDSGQPFRIESILPKMIVINFYVKTGSTKNCGHFVTARLPIEKEGELVERGAFRVMRYPSYIGVLLAFVGFALSLGNRAALLFTQARTKFAGLIMS